VHKHLQHILIQHLLNKNDDANGLGGTLIGRYESDSYDGCASSGGSRGHAWILCSNALADLWYRNSEMINKKYK